MTNSFKSKQGYALSSFLVLLSVFIIGGLTLAYFFGYIVPPGMMGVRQMTVKIPLGPKQGYSEKALRPGYHWSIPFFSYIHKVPQTLQTFHFSRLNSNLEDTTNSLEVQTSDGSSVDVDVSVFYHFLNQSTADHGGPAQLLTQVGLKANWIDRIRTVAENELKGRLGKLSTSEFYNPHLRELQLELAFKEMNKRLQPLGIKIEDVLIQRYTYSEERIDRAIFEKNLQNQEERLNAASSRLADAQATLEAVSAEWDAKIETLKVEGSNKALVLKSEASLYEVKKNAEADLLLAKSVAEADRLKSVVLAEGKAARIYVARQMVPILQSLKGGLVSGIDPFDVSAWTKRLGVEGKNNESE